MFCKKCGAQLQEGNYFCPMCGTNNADNATEETQETGVQKADALAGVKDAIKGFGVKKIGIIAAVVVGIMIMKKKKKRRLEEEEEGLVDEYHRLIEDEHRES